MRYFALATDYDGTIARHGSVDEPTLASLKRAIESDLTQALELALGEEALRRRREDEVVGAPMLQRVAAANQRVQLARRFLNDAVTDVHRVRRKPGVRLLRLAGHAELPQTFEIDDELPMLVRGV